MTTPGLRCLENCKLNRIASPNITLGDAFAWTDDKVSIMTKKSFLLFFAFISLLGGYFTVAGFQFDASDDNKASSLKAGSHKIRGYSTKSSMQDLNTNAAPSDLTRGDQGSMTANEAMITGEMVKFLDKLLASNDLNEFAEPQIKEIESFCQNHKHPLSEVSCQVLQHQLYLIKKQDDLSNSLESDWVAIDHNGGGIALEENNEITALSSDEQITGESGRLGEDVESSLENLADRALFDHSAKVRNKARSHINEKRSIGSAFSRCP
jgi:hypothetical protein